MNDATDQFSADEIIAFDEAIGSFDKIVTGDTITIDLPEKRRWWQLWKPKWRTRRHAFTVTEVRLG